MATSIEVPEGHPPVSPGGGGCLPDGHSPVDGYEYCNEVAETTRMTTNPVGTVNRL
jgi:hypothetical protein